LEYLHTSTDWVPFKESEHFENLNIDGRIILNLILSRVGGLYVTNITGSRLEDWIYWHFGYKFSYSHQLYCYTLSVHSCTRTRILRLH
jgi:hypothetical protein